MGRKSKAEEYGLVELIIEQWEGGKNTIVYVTEEVNRLIREKGLSVYIGRETVRKIIRSERASMDRIKKALEDAKAFASVLRDNSASEIAEGAVIHLASLLLKNLETIEELNFDDPEKLINAVSKITNSQMKLQDNRLKAIEALEKAKTEIKKELQKAIQNDGDLLERLNAIVDKAEVA